MRAAAALLLLLCLGAARGHANPAADERAAELALAQPRVQRQLAALREEVGKIASMERRDELLGMLDRPSFQVLAKRRYDEWAVLARLKREGLIAESAKSLLPQEPPMKFAAAPGSVWRGHHSYPGGLIDHELFNLRAGVALSGAYYQTYGLRLDEDLLRSVAVMHDLAKTATLHWKEDGSLPAAEPTVAGTPLHHILGVAEALLRGWPAPWVVALASCHSPPHPGPELTALIGYLRAGAIIAGMPYERAGLDALGRALARPAPIEAFVSHVDDHDFVLTETSISAVEKSLPQSQARAGGPDHWSRDAALAKDGDLIPYQALGLKTRRP